MRQRASYYVYIVTRGCMALLAPVFAYFEAQNPTIHSPYH